MKHGCHVGMFGKPKRVIFLENLKPKRINDEKNENNDGLGNMDFDGFNDAFSINNVRRNRLLEDNFNDGNVASTSSMKRDSVDRYGNDMFSVNTIKRKHLVKDNDNENAAKKIKVVSDENMVPRYKYNMIKEKLNDYKLSYSRLMTKHLAFKESADEKYCSLLKTLNGVKTEDANKNIIIEKYKNAVATVQKMAVEERKKNNQLQSMLDTTKILGIIFYLISIILIFRRQ